MLTSTRPSPEPLEIFARPRHLLLAAYRRATARARALPSFLIIGTQKGGTTSLFKYLVGSPTLKGAYTKEVRYFTGQFHRGLTWYRTQFPVCAPGEQTFEATPCLFHPEAPRRVKETVPGARMIVLLRDPVTRAYSHWAHNRRKGRETLDFPTAIETEDARIEAERADGNARWTDVAYRGKGAYATQIEGWFKHFPQDQFLILQSEKMFADPARTVADICAWLDVEMPPALPDRTHNKGVYHSDVDPAVEAALREHFRPLNEQLFTLLGERFDWPGA